MFEREKSYFIHVLLSIFGNKIDKYCEGKLEFANTDSWSQEGEDLILKKYFGSRGVTEGFFVDVGAHHPKRFSNTYMFYCLGWRGINIDAKPNSMEIFDELRPDDINIESAVSDKVQDLTYYMFNEPALNTFSRDIALTLDQDNPAYSIEKKVTLQTKTLANILDEHLKEDTQIDYLSIDVEGYDFNVLKSLDFDKYRPGAILIEDLGSTLENVLQSELYRYLSKLEYRLMSRTFNTLIFCDKHT